MHLQNIFNIRGSDPFIYFSFLVILYIYIGVQTQGRLDGNSFESDVCCSSCGCLQVIGRRFFPCTLDRRYCINIRANGSIAFIYSFSTAFDMVVFLDRVFGYFNSFHFHFSSLRI